MRQTSDEPFTVDVVHKDWERDELLFERKDGRGENLYRLDFILGEDNAFQAQLFLVTELKEGEWEERCEEGGEETKYVGASLFIERDNRIPREEGGDGERWDYACDAWRITSAEAVALLAKGEKEAVELMCGKVEMVRLRANDREFIRKYFYDERERVKVEKKWAVVDAAR